MLRSPFNVNFILTTQDNSYLFLQCPYGVDLLEKLQQSQGWLSFLPMPNSSIVDNMIHIKISISLGKNIKNNNCLVAYLIC